jgi:cation diffusion facilitator CzcD-associated flavoprotein CzcO
MSKARATLNFGSSFADRFRYTPGTGYLEALVSSNSTVVTNEIDHIDSEGLVTNDGQHYAVDAIICATGFDTSFKPVFPVLGVNRPKSCGILER